MLYNFEINVSKPNGFLAVLSSIYKRKGKIENPYDGIYLMEDGSYSFNTQDFLVNNGCKVINKYPSIKEDEYIPSYGVCDSYNQFLMEYPILEELTNRKFVVTFTPVHRNEQDSYGGWRWHKWGKYIGVQNPEHEYLYDDTHIDKIYCFHIFEVE